MDAGDGTDGVGIGIDNRSYDDEGKDRDGLEVGTIDGGIGNEVEGIGVFNRSIDESSIDNAAQRGAQGRTISQHIRTRRSRSPRKRHRCMDRPERSET